MANPAISPLLPLSSAREETLMSLLAESVEAALNRVALAGEMVIVSPDTVEPPVPVTVTVTLYVPDPVGVPEMMPVVALMWRPGGRPEAVNVFGDCVAVTVNVNCVPEGTVIEGTEMTTGEASVFER